MIYFQSKYLAEKLNINLAKWKRWSRTFLPPDPLGGLRSGYARQFSLKEAFCVHLGGYLVSTLKFTVPEAQQILHDLEGWLTEEGYYSLQVPPDYAQSGALLAIYILLNNNGHLRYFIDRFNPKSQPQFPLAASSMSVEEIHADSDRRFDPQRLIGARMLLIRRFYAQFLSSIQG